MYARYLERLHEAGEQDASFRFDFYNHSDLSSTAQSSINLGPRRTGSFMQERSIMRSHLRQNSFAGSQAAPSPMRKLSAPVARTGPFPSLPAYNPHQSRAPSIQPFPQRGAASLYAVLNTPTSYTDSSSPIFQMGTVTTNAFSPPSSQFLTLPGTPEINTTRKTSLC